MIVLIVYTLITGGPFLWVATMSLRTTGEIFDDRYALPTIWHWGKFAEAWTKANYGTYFWNSTIVVISAVVLVTLIGAMTAHCLARYDFRGSRLVRFIILSGMILPPQLLILSLFQIMLNYGLYNSLLGLIVVYVATQLAMTVYILEGFFAQIPQDLFDAAQMDGYSQFEIFWRITLPIGLPAIFTAVVLNFILLWNEFLFAVVLLTDDDKRTLPLGLMRFMGGHQLDIGMVATGLMISIAPVLLIYAVTSETMIKGMTAGRSPLGLGTDLAIVTIEGLSKQYDRGGEPAVKDVSLTVADGEFMVLLGPSGCGKSSVLRMIAGLEPITFGTVSIDGTIVNDVPAKNRDIAMVFQSYALYPHMSVYDNLAFGLRRRGFVSGEIDRRVRDAAVKLDLTAYLARKPHALSGGQRQRVALGRAIVRAPKVLLLDEPLSNLDAALRLNTRNELIKQQAELGTTTIYVTHDQIEAMTMGHRICIMSKGEVVQVGAPLEVYRHPVNTFVARFLGGPPMNLIPAQFDVSGG